MSKRCVATEAEPHNDRLDKSMEEMHQLYDADMVYGEEAIAYCHTFPFGERCPLGEPTAVEIDDQGLVTPPPPRAGRPAAARRALPPPYEGEPLLTSTACQRRGSDPTYGLPDEPSQVWLTKHLWTTT